MIQYATIEVAAKVANDAHIRGFNFALMAEAQDWYATVMDMPQDFDDDARQHAISEWCDKVEEMICDLPLPAPGQGDKYDRMRPTEGV